MCPFIIIILQIVKYMLDLEQKLWDHSAKLLCVFYQLTTKLFEQNLPKFENRYQKNDM